MYDLLKEVREAMLPMCVFFACLSGCSLIMSKLLSIFVLAERLFLVHSVDPGG